MIVYMWHYFYRHQFSLFLLLTVCRTHHTVSWTMSTGLIHLNKELDVIWKYTEMMRASTDVMCLLATITSLLQFWTEAETSRLQICLRWSTTSALGGGTVCCVQNLEQFVSCLDVTREKGDQTRQTWHMKFITTERAPPCGAPPALLLHYLANQTHQKLQGTSKASYISCLKC